MFSLCYFRQVVVIRNDIILLMKNIRLFNFISYFKELYFYTPIYTLFLLQGDMSLSILVLAGSIYSIAVFFK